MDAWLITPRGFSILVKLGPAPKLSDEEVFARIHRLAHPQTCRKAQLALEQDPSGPAWQSMRTYWADASEDISNALKWIGVKAHPVGRTAQTGPVWKDRLYSHPVEPAPAVLRGVRLYIAALAARHGWNRRNALASHWEGLDDLAAGEIAALAARLHRGKHPRRPPGLFGKFSQRMVKRSLRKATRDGQPARRARQAHRRQLRRYLHFRAKHGHGRVWESPRHADLLPWLRKVVRLSRVGRLSGDVDATLRGAGFNFQLVGAPRVPWKNLPRPLPTRSRPFETQTPGRAHP